MRSLRILYIKRNNKYIIIMTINELQDNVIEDFSSLDDWMDKYAMLIDLGNSLE